MTAFGRGWQSIIHFTAGGGHGSVLGDHTPAVWIQDHNRIDVYSALRPTNWKQIPFAATTGKWMSMDISQYMVADNKV